MTLKLSHIPLLLLTIFLIVQVDAQNYTQTKRIENPGGPFWAVGSNIGECVDVHGDIAVAGAPQSDSANLDHGAALVFYRNEGGPNNWGTVKRLTAPGLIDNATLGSDVAVWGDWIALTATVAYQSFSDVFFLYHRNEGGPDNWGLYKTIEIDSSAQLGRAVAMYDTTLVVVDGSRGYIFYQNEGGTNNWGLANYVEPTRVGFSSISAVDIYMDKIAIGVDDDDTTFQDVGAVTIFQKDVGGTGNWGQVKKIIPSNPTSFDFFGTSVSLYEDRLAVGARNGDGATSGTGLAFVLEKDEGGIDNWGEVKIVEASDGADGDDFGIGVAINDDYLAVGAYFDDDNGTSSGSAYIFGKDEGGPDNWGEVKKIIPNDNMGSDWFGASVAFGGNQLFVGSEKDDDQGTGSGSLYVFENDEGGTNNWGQIAESHCTDGARQDFFAEVVVQDGDYIAIGCNYDDVEFYRSGSVFLYGRNVGGAGNWGMVKRFNAPTQYRRLAYGTSVDLEDTLLVCGTPYLPIAFGRAYIYGKNTGGSNNWGLTKIIAPSDSASAGGYAFDIDLSGHTIASATFIPGGGVSVYLYYKDEGGINNWGEVKKIVASTAPLDGVEETTVTLDGNTMAVGSEGDHTVHIYAKDEGGVDNWGEIKVLSAPMVDSPNVFGFEVDLSGDLLAVGALEDNEVANEAGAVYLYGRNVGGANNWGLIKKITKAGLDAGAEFGYAVSVQDSILAVGASRQNSNQGAVYIYKKDQGGFDNWGFAQEVMGQPSASPDRFGYAVDLYQDELLVGASRDVDDRGADSAGSAFHFDKDDSPCPDILVISSETINSNTSYFAGQEIQLNNVDLNNPGNLFLTAPEILIDANFTMEIGTILETIQEDGCE